MELQFYLSILWRRKWLILLSAILAGVLAYFIISLKPPVYKSEAILSTGVIDYTGINSSKDNPFIQKLQIDMRFNNLMEFVTSRRCLNFLSFHLLNHDLQPEEFGTGPFRTVVDLSAFQQQELEALTKLLATKIDDLKPEFSNSEDELFFNKVAKELEYDFESLREDYFTIGRMGETDYVRFTFESESPELSAFAASKFSNSFIDYFESLRKGENEETIKYLAESAKEKKRVLTNKQNTLEGYKERGQLVDLEAQREATVNQIKELEQDRNEAQKEFNANEKTIINLSDLLKGLDPSEPKVVAQGDDATLTNKKILNLRAQVKDLTEQLIDGRGKKRQVESKLKAVKKKLNIEIKTLAKLTRKVDLEKPEVDDNTISNDLYEKRVDATIAMTSAEEELTIITDKLGELNARAKSYVSDEAYVINLQREIDIAKKEYEDIVKKLSEEELSTNRDDSPLTIIEHAQLPEKSESDKKLLFTAFSGVVGGSMATFFIFLLTFLDSTMNSPNQFKVFTGLPLLGGITKINTKKLNLQALFDGSIAKLDFEKFKELVRDFRFNIEKIKGGKVFLITSPREDEGKSFLITILAHSLLLKQKRVLVIDTNFKRNTLSTWSVKPTRSSAILHQILVDSKLNGHFAITTLESPFNNSPIETISNSGKTRSPLEGMGATDFALFLKNVSNLYDYVFLEGAALNEYSDTKELVDFSDKVIVVFSAESTIKQADKDSIAFLEGLEDKFAGAVLNRINRKNLN